MDVFVGTSGWSYGWNRGGNFDWFLKNSRLNTVELNASFYRFPFPNQVKSWARKTTECKDPDLRWSIKVNRLITHIYKFSSGAFNIWKKFEKLFEPLSPNIDFYLFQLHPKITPNSAEKLEKFIAKTNLREEFALEFRNMEWFETKWIKWAKKLGITVVSVDSPKFPRDVFKTTKLVYVRMHGRQSWYSHNYSNKELKEVAEKILKTRAKKAYVYFNNNHAMLKNARTMLKLFRNMKNLSKQKK